MPNRIAIIDPYFDPSEPRHNVRGDDGVAFGNVSDSHRYLAVVKIMTNVYQAHRTGTVSSLQVRKRMSQQTSPARQRNSYRALSKRGFCRVHCLENPPSLGTFLQPLRTHHSGGIIAPYGLDDFSSGATHNAKDDLQPMSKVSTRGVGSSM